MSHESIRVIDVWMQHPNSRFLAQPFLESLRRWLGASGLPLEISVAQTIGAMDAIRKGYTTIEELTESMKAPGVGDAVPLRPVGRLTVGDSA